MLVKTYSVENGNVYEPIEDVGKFFQYRDTLIRDLGLKRRVPADTYIRPISNKDLKEIVTMDWDVLNQFATTDKDGMEASLFDALKMKVGIDIIDCVYAENPEITITDAAARIYQKNYRGHYLSQIQQFLYFYFSLFPDGYYVYAEDSPMGILYKIFPCESII